MSPARRRAAGLAWLALPALVTCSAAAIRSAEGTPPSPAPSLLLRAGEAFEAGRYPEAVELLERHLAAHATDLEARVRLGWCRYRLGEFARAATEFRAALEADPASGDAWVGLGYVRLQTDGPEPAAEAFRGVLAEHPADRDALRGMVLAGRRGEASPRLREEALRAAEAILERAPADPETLNDWVELKALARSPGERRLRPPADPAAPLCVAARAHRDYLQVRDADGSWRSVFVKGFNLGTALPGRFPTEFPEAEATYREWLGTMAGLGANTVRVYTLLPPAFYRALAAHNAAPGGRSLHLIQGAWSELPPRHDFSDRDYVASFQAEIRRVIDAVHGNLALAPRPGHAWGLYDTDASASLLALVVGHEWEPFAVRDYNELRRGETAWRGAWLGAARAGPMECWVARMCDFAVGHEVARYRSQHPVTFANWPTLDPLHHPTESSRAEEDAWKAKYGLPYERRLREAPWDDDLVSLDATRIRPTSKMEAGFFAAYHIYPNYPDFLNLEPSYAEGRDGAGPNRYAAYLEALKAYHGEQPVLVAEFGISTSRGIAHVQPQGWHHGGHDERAQGELVARMLQSIWAARYAGGIVFSFLDEWFKGTWSVAPLEQPAERRRLWFNAESPEQSYGILAARPGTGRLLVDGKAGDWEGVAPFLEAAWEVGEGWASLRSVRLASDEGYLYVLLETGGGAEPPERSGVGFRLALDTYGRDRGETRLPAPGATRVPTGAEFLVDLAGPERSFVHVTASYEPGQGLRVGKLYSARGGAGGFVPLELETNRERFGRDGTRYAAVRVDRGKLRYGSLDPASAAYDTRTDVAVGAGIVELRLPWGLLNVADPSSRRVIHQETHSEPPLGTVETEGLRLYVFALDLDHPEAPPLARLPRGRESPAAFAWQPWEEPRYRLELKAGAERIGRAMRGLPDTLAPVLEAGRREVNDAS
jgi:tetratricopeptide (TPR) repeat protein